jgi:hypothetical protein
VKAPACGSSVSAWLRFVEYSFSAAVMVVLIALQVGIMVRPILRCKGLVPSLLTSKLLYVGVLWFGQNAIDICSKLPYANLLQVV